MPFSCRRCKVRQRRLLIEPLEARYALAAGFSEFVDPDQTVDDGFGSTILPLSTGNVVITAPYDDAGGHDAGAVYLFNGRTGALISTLLGAQANENLGARDSKTGTPAVTVLADGDFLVQSVTWASGAATNAGAVTFVNGKTGLNAVVGPANSLVGSAKDDQIGSNTQSGGPGVLALSDGNYVVRSPNWDNGTKTDAGAVTFGNGTTGTSGVITDTNSLVGSTANDQVGSGGVVELATGNYVVASPLWDGSAIDEGAATFGSGATGVVGAISSSNSLVGDHSNDNVGSAGITVLASGNYVVKTPNYNLFFSQSGAATFGDGHVGITGTISDQNSLLGGFQDDHVGAGVKALPNGNYVVVSPSWSGAIFATPHVGAVTWGSGTAGAMGEVSANNSLVGSTQNDSVGSGGVTVLSNGNYVIDSPLWNGPGATRAGAVTWGSGTSGVKGVVGITNSLLGGTMDDRIGFGVGNLTSIYPLTNGNYVVCSPNWDNGTVQDAGAATWANGLGGTTGAVSGSNSFVGSTQSDYVCGDGVVALAGGNYVVRSSFWNNGSATGAGAATLGNGSGGGHGMVGPANSLVGTTQDENLGYEVFALAGGSYLVPDGTWDSPTAQDVGAVAFGNALTGVHGTIDATNSLVGTHAGDQVGQGFNGDGVVPLASGNYIVRDPVWDNGANVDAGAVVFGNGTTGIVGEIHETNALVGAHASNFLNDEEGVALPNGNYVADSPAWDNDNVQGAGAVTLINGLTGRTGALTATGSIIGPKADDRIGDDSTIHGVHALPNSNFVILSSYYDNGSDENVGAVTLGNGNTPQSVVVSAANSDLGSVSNPGIDGYAPMFWIDQTDDVNQTFFVNLVEDNRIIVGSQIDGFAHHWHLAARPNDVNNDAHVAANDAVAVINYINAGFPAAVAADAQLGKPYGFVDVTGDDFVAANDALAVINAINAAQGGEGEQPVESPMSKVQSQERGAAAVDGALMMLLAMDVNGQAGKRRV